MSTAEAFASDELVVEAIHPDEAANGLMSLRVVDGLQAGASVPLESGSRIAVGGAGGDLHDDITLRDPSVGDASVVLQRDELGIEVRALAGQVSFDGATLGPGGSQRIRCGDSILIGCVSLEIVAMSLPTTIDTETHRAETNAAGVRDEVPGVRRTGITTQSDQAESSPGVLARVGRIGSLAVLVGIAGAVALWQGGGLTPPPVAVVSIEALLAGPAYGALAIDDDNDVPIINGIVSTRTDKLDLELLLRDAGVRYVDRVVSDEDLADRIATVLRVNDIPADVKAVDAGAALVATRVADASRLKDLEARVRQDVPALASLAVENTPPPVIDTPEKARRIDPGKRVSMVVSADPAHVVTEDESRYFIGSLLPSGHRIAAIDGGRVSLVKSGLTTELDF